MAKKLTAEEKAAKAKAAAEKKAAKAKAAAEKNNSATSATPETPTRKKRYGSHWK